MKPLPESESKSEQFPTISTEDGCYTATSSQSGQNVSCHQESGNLDNNCTEIPSSNSHVIQMESRAGEGCSRASSAPPQQSVQSNHQGSRNPNNPLEIQSADSDVPGESAGGDGDPAASSAQVPQPYCRQVSAEDRKTYLKLYKAAKDGKWKAAKRILESEDGDSLLRADLTNRKETILHVATQANQAGFVRQLLNYRTYNEIKSCLESEDVDGNTAFIFAVASGNMKIVNIMRKKDSDLLKKNQRQKQLTPLHIAALHEQSEMARYLYKSTTSENFKYEFDDLKLLFFLCVNAGIYDLALELLMRKQDLAFEMDHKRETVLQILSLRPLGLKQTQQNQLLRYLWNDIFLGLIDSEIVKKINRRPHVVFNAAKVGNFKFLELLISSYPYLVWEVDESKRSVIHVAVLHRQADIFNFTRSIGSIKDIIVRHKASDGSNLLHMAASLPSKDRLNLVSGAAFQMTLELLWFEEVKKMVPPSFIEEKVRGLTPRELFTKKHKDLVKEAQSWTKKTTNCCMLVSTLITTGVFTATFSIPGGVKDDTGSPHYLVDDKIWFIIFSIFDAIAMISSSTSIFIFFSILISRHAEDDFQYRSLPMKLIFGLITLLISIISMMVSFSSAFMMYYNAKTLSHGSNYNALERVAILICALSIIPIPIFVCLLCPLGRDIWKLTKFSWLLS